jgi:aminoglycoside phosphotransferase (APT) family kinase protein
VCCDVRVGGESGSKVAEVNKYVRAVVKGCTQIRATTPVDRGENHVVYRVSYLDSLDVERDVVVRISNADGELDRRQAEREAAVLSHLRGAVSPRLLDFDPDPAAFAGRAVMCLEYIDGGFEPLETAPPGRLIELGSIVRRTHRTPIDSLTPVLGEVPKPQEYVDARLDSMLARMSLVRDPLPESMQTMFDDAARWAKGAAAQLRVSVHQDALVLLHGDVSAGNIMWTPGPVLIDWEYARIGDAADEIGYLFGQNALRSSQRNGFWRGYGDGLDRASIARIVGRAAMWEPLTLFGSALYWIELWSRRIRAHVSGTVDPSAPKEPAYYVDYAARYLSRCDRTR